MVLSAGILGGGTGTIDNFNAGLDPGWVTSEGEFLFRETGVVWEGSASLRAYHDQSRTLDMYSLPGDGLPNYFDHGEWMRIYVRADSSGTSGPRYTFYFGYTNSSDWYYVTIEFNSGTYRLSKNNNGTASQLAAENVYVTTDRWYRIDVIRHDGTGWRPADTIQTRLYDTYASTYRGNIMATDTTHREDSGMQHIFSTTAQGALFVDEQYSTPL